jgi:flagellar assembly protein FliH
MSSSSRVISRVLRGEAVATATAETFEPRASNAPVLEKTPLVDPLAAERAAAYQEGYRAALAQVSVSDEAAQAAQASRVFDALIAAAASARSQREAALAQAEHEAVELAFELAEALLGRELSLSPSLSIEAVQRALTLVPQGEDLVVRLHPDDVVTPEELQALVIDASVKVVVDPAVEAGGCVVEAGPCRIDAQIGPAMTRARALIDSVGKGSRGSL